MHFTIDANWCNLIVSTFALIVSAYAIKTAKKVGCASIIMPFIINEFFSLKKRKIIKMEALEDNDCLIGAIHAIINDIQQNTLIFTTFGFENDIRKIAEDLENLEEKYNKTLDQNDLREKLNNIYLRLNSTIDNIENAIKNIVKNKFLENNF